MYYVTIALVIGALTTGCYGGQQEQYPPKPYVFSYTAGRIPGHIDRVHSEASDGLVTRGMFSYVDPRQKIRTVEYVADQNGFHPLLITNPVVETRAVENERNKHYVLFNKIAAEHQRVALERGQNEEYDESLYDDTGYDPNVLLSHPQDTPAVEKAKLRHYDLYNRIAEEHARIAAERGDYNEEPTEEQYSEQYNDQYNDQYNEQYKGQIVKIGYHK